MKFLVDPNEPLRHVRNWMQNYLMSNEYEPVTTKIVEELVKPGHIAIDIGASIGYFSMLLSRVLACLVGFIHSNLQEKASNIYVKIG